MRQKSDIAFVERLNRLREGNYTDEDLKMMHSRCVVNKNSLDMNEKQLQHLFCRRVDALAHNDTILSDIPPYERVEVDAIDSITGNTSCFLQEKNLSRIPLDPTKTMGLQKNCYWE